MQSLILLAVRTDGGILQLQMFRICGASMFPCLRKRWPSLTVGRGGRLPVAPGPRRWALGHQPTVRHRAACAEDAGLLLMRRVESRLVLPLSYR